MKAQSVALYLGMDSGLQLLLKVNLQETSKARLPHVRFFKWANWIVVNASMAPAYMFRQMNAIFAEILCYTLLYRQIWSRPHTRVSHLELHRWLRWQCRSVLEVWSAIFKQTLWTSTPASFSTQNLWATLHISCFSLLFTVKTYYCFSVCMYVFV